MTAVAVFCFLSFLLAAGKFLRMRFSLLQRLYLPSSVIGGLLGIIVFSCAGDVIPAQWRMGATKCPGFLINIIFASLFLGIAIPKAREIFKLALPQFCLGQIIAWGQYVVGLGLAGFFFADAFGVPVAFGNLLEIGFEGGHGTVGGMVDSFKAFNWEDGIALGFTVATFGMIIGIVGGMTLIQWAHRRGYVREVRTFSDRKWCERVGIHPRGRRPIAGIQTVASDSIDSLAWHCAVIGLSVAIGWALHSFIPIKGFPLFPLCMIGGVLIMLAAKLVKQDLLIDRTQMEHISGAALDYLIVSAVATIRLDVVAENWMPLLILILAGSLWSAAAVVFIAPRIFKKSWFECAIAEFGQATGVTATGLMLLRTVDPENRTPAAMSFGYKQLLHEPIMGGGFWTAFAFTLVFTIGWVKVFFISLIMLAIFSALFVIISKSGGRSSRA